MRIAFILSILLSTFSLNNATFSQTIKPNTSTQMSSNETSSNNDLIKTNGAESTSTLIVKLLSNNVEDRLHKAGSILNITSKLPQVRNASFAYLLNQTLSTLHGIPEDTDTEKRKVAQNILSSYKDFQIILFIMPNGDIYFDEPYSRQQNSTTTNLAFRDYFQGAIRTNDTYLGNVNTSASSGQRQALIAVPVYSLKDNSTVVGVWAGGIDFDGLNKELQSLDLTAGERVVYVDHNGNKIADSDENNTNARESFANLTSFKNAINGQSGSIIETIGSAKMIVTYQPVKAFHNAWAVLLMQQS